MSIAAVSRSRFSVFVAAGTLIMIVLGVSGANSQTETAPQTNSTVPSASELIKVPVTKLLAGDVNLAPKIENPVADDSAAAGRGMKYFTYCNCIGCHADNGGGGMGPALSNRAFIYGGDPQNIYLTIAQGRPNGMPAWGALLPSGVIWDLVAYVRSISDEPDNGWGNTTSIEAMKIEQVPAEFQSTPTPWQHTQPFTDGQKPGGG
jgi:cytochrome c oxidase cbb3-type subunit III